MQTRSGFCYPRPESDNQDPFRGKRKLGLGFGEPYRKRHRLSSSSEAAAAAGEYGCGSGHDLFDGIPDDLVLLILSKLSASATSPSDLFAVLITCKRLKKLGVNPMVLAKVSAKSMAIRASKWCESAHRFLKLCADSGNLEACYTLGMIRFYCLGSRGNGAAMMARAAMGSHAAALYALAVIQFNGSGGAKTDKDLRAGVALCARAAFLGHIDALRELGHCLQDGYGVRRNVTEGRRFLIQANLQELATVPDAAAAAMAIGGGGGVCPLLSDFGWALEEREEHAANRFMVEWFTAKGLEEGMRMCSHGGCGRPETRRHEFRRCSVCGAVNYCSRACQALHWKLAHKAECTPMDRWNLAVAGAGAAPPAAMG
ncbi:F-box protein At1g67340-like [Dioscorea cayenensis subsp. rotundata]|uniref:F-box protein At1g67340-like n=1 Tax=Dioscorea cayennensis subsp. rotundata TaxID=55577 RepID=A0AB40B1J2_DIOCR|nr:F-box protein At1g67340-like [Dioscorea cayenensis subsp. rotundata]